MRSSANYCRGNLRPRSTSESQTSLRMKLTHTRSYVSPNSRPSDTLTSFVSWSRGFPPSFSALMASPLSRKRSVFSLATSLGNRLGRTVTAGDVVSELQERGFSEQPLAMSAQVRERIELRNEAYIHRVQKSLINGAYIPRTQTAAIVEKLITDSQSLLLAGSAGEGKTCLVAQVLKALHEAGVPHLALSMDELEGIVSSADLGERLGLPASPAIVLGQISVGSPAVLCIDQLDSLSFVSGP